jgi:hypothetical protein
MLYTEIEYMNMMTDQATVITVSKWNRVKDIAAKRPKKGKYYLLRIAAYDGETFETVEEITY